MVNGVDSAPDPHPIVQPGRSASRPFASGLWVVAASTIASRILGMFRDTVTARLFGVSPVADAFWLAFKVPNLCRRLFGEGALTAAFLPAFTRELTLSSSEVPRNAWQLAGAVFCLLAAFLAALVLSGEAVVWILSWSFVDDPHTRLLLGLIGVMLPYAMLICLAAQATAALQALEHFAWPALLPVVLNVCWISSVWLVDPWFEPDRAAQAYALAVCVVGAGVLQLGLQWPTLARLGFRLRDILSRERRVEAFEVFRNMLPVVVGLSIEQINALIDGLIAWSFAQPTGGGPMPLPGSPLYPLETGAVTALYLAERLYQFPLGVFGIALGTVLFPLFARHAAHGDIARLRDDLTLGLRLVIAIGVPASAGLIVMALPLTRLLFEHGEFTHDDARRTAALVVAYGSGVWAFCALPILYRGFYALGDRLSPLRIGMWAVLWDLVLNLTLIWPFAERGLAWSTSMSAIGQMSCLVWLIQRRVGRLDWRQLRATTLRTLPATAVMTVACLSATQLFPSSYDPWQKVLAALGPVAIGILAYLAAARLLGLEELRWLLTRTAPASNDN